MRLDPDELDGFADHRELDPADRRTPAALAVQAATGGPDPEGFADRLGDWHPDHFDLEEARRRFDP